jgi:ATP-dependent DNA helicase RecQ
MTARLAAARAALKSVFGYDDFRPGQAEIVAAVLAGKDVLAVMPTGSGKSMCYQLPALVDDALTVVVSPLIALMRDQVHQMAAFGVPAATLNSMATEEEALETWRLLRSGELRLLFVSPERLMADGLTARLKELGAKRLAIDEAHCVSQWGHDFRPEYREIAHVRAALGHVQTLALTATADQATREDMIERLFPEKPQVFVHSFDRPNITLRFAAKDQPRRQLGNFLAGYKGASGIVYCSSRKRTETLAEYFKDQGFRALPYHAGLDQRLRGRHQDTFLQEDGVVMVATVAFGMGINKPDVRFVCHADMPANVESYYQEIGRAGRDGLPADTLTLYGLDDMGLRRRQIDEKEVSDERRRIEQKKLEAMISLCESPSCRRQGLLAYFGEARGLCGHCDVCAGKVATYDATLDAQKVLSAVARTGQRFGASYIADVVGGRDTDAIRRNGHDRLKTFGVGADRSQRVWRSLIRQLFAAGALKETSGEYPGLSLTAKGEAILFGREAITLRPEPDRRPRQERRERGPLVNGAAVGLQPSDEPLFQHLRSLRAAIARDEGVAAFIVFPDRTLIEMARLRPIDLAALRFVHGVGERKLAAYGPIFVKAIAEFLGR